MKNGFVFFQGPSEIDGSPVLAIATGLIAPSTNRKTGPMVQIHLISASHHPLDAIHLGLDRGICGECRHRGTVSTGSDGRSRNTERSCYVRVFAGPAMVWKAWQRGLYDDVTPVQAQRLLRGRMVRLGSYGDPGCVPAEILEVVLAKAEVVTGYTHRWDRRPDLARWCMASVDTPEERDLAKALGFRTFRVRDGEEPVLSGEGQCPASHEMGQVTRCSECRLCGGHQGLGVTDVTICAHGAGAVHFHNPKHLRTAA